MLRVGDIVKQAVSGRFYLVYEITDDRYRLHLVGRNTLGDSTDLQDGILYKHQYTEDKYPRAGRGRLENKKLVLAREAMNIGDKFKVKYRL